MPRVINIHLLPRKPYFTHGDILYIYICIYTYIRMLYTYIEQAQRVQRTYIVECRVSILGITITLWVSIPHNNT